MLPLLLQVTFTPGISYVDIITLDLTLTVDPDKTRAVGAGEERTAVSLAPACNLAVLKVSDAVSLPPADSNPQTCGTVVQLPFTSVAPGRAAELATREPHEGVKGGSLVGIPLPTEKFKYNKYSASMKVNHVFIYS